MSNNDNDYGNRSKGKGKEQLEPIEMSFGEGHDMKLLNSQIGKGNERISGCRLRWRDKLLPLPLSYDRLKSEYHSSKRDNSSSSNEALLNHIRSDICIRNWNREKRVKMDVWNKLYYKGIISKKKQMAYREKSKRDSELKNEKECSFKPVITSIKLYTKTNSEIWQIDNFIKNCNQKVNNHHTGNSRNQMLRNASTPYELYKRNHLNPNSNIPDKNISVNRRRVTPIVVSRTKKECKSKANSIHKEPKVNLGYKEKYYSMLKTNTSHNHNTTQNKTKSCTSKH